MIVLNVWYMTFRGRRSQSARRRYSPLCSRMKASTIQIASSVGEWADPALSDMIPGLLYEDM